MCVCVCVCVCANACPAPKLSFTGLNLYYPFSLTGFRSKVRKTIFPKLPR